MAQEPVQDKPSEEHFALGTSGWGEGEADGDSIAYGFENPVPLNEQPEPTEEGIPNEAPPTTPEPQPTAAEPPAQPTATEPVGPEAWLDLPPEQRTEAFQRQAAEQPETLIPGYMKDADYRRKTQNVAEVKRELGIDAKEDLTVEAVRRALAGRQAPPPPQPDASEVPIPVAPDGTNQMRWAADYYQRTGNAPTDRDWDNYCAEAAGRKAAMEQMMPFLTQQVRQAFDSQYEALKQQYPGAGNPGVEQRLREYLDANNPLVQPVQALGLDGRPMETGAVESAFMACFGAEVMAGVNQRLNASTQARASARQTPIVPPTTAAGPEVEKPTTDPNEILRRQHAKIARGEIPR